MRRYHSARISYSLFVTHISLIAVVQRRARPIDARNDIDDDADDDDDDDLGDGEFNIYGE